MKIETKFNPGDLVAHITDDATIGIVTAFMVRGTNHSYEAQWGTENLRWHLEFELAATRQCREIGFWRDTPR